MNRRMAGILAASLVLGMALTGCTRDQAQGGAGNYKIKTYQDGAQHVLSQGKGINVRVLNDIRRSFAREQMRLTNEGYAEDGRGNVTYQYTIENKPSQCITIHAFTSRHELLNRMPHWYGQNKVVATPTSRVEIYNGRNASIVYTSIGRDKGKYSDQIKAMSPRLLDELNLPQDHIPSGEARIFHE
ncbi:hypothetical protein [Paenibacillus sp. sgz500958]|uniref:hypothetical protein n=1 Tax=Paenibacillus sp. sgz500958 TaxID=3242475 RepID=UPI0036D2B405